MSDIKKTNTVKKAVEPKAESKLDAKKEAKIESKKETTQTKTEKPKKKGDNSTGGIIAKLKKLITKKKKHPVFRGRFGIRQIRSKSKEKFDKWRVPRGIDIKWKKGDGCRVKGGYKNPEEIRGLHPSGYRETKVCNVKDLAKVEKETHAARISSTVGKKKRELIKKEAEKKGIKILN